jgi:hypothetical protein
LIAGNIDAGALPFDFRFLEEGQDRWNCFETSLRLPEIVATTRRKIAANRTQVLCSTSILGKRCIANLVGEGCSDIAADKKG